MPTASLGTADASADTNAAASAVVLRQVIRLEEFTMLGSNTYPLIIIANPDRPEAGYGFEVSLVKGKWTGCCLLAIVLVSKHLRLVRSRYRASRLYTRRLSHPTYDNQLTTR